MVKFISRICNFYNVPMNMGILETLWEWIHDENHIVNGYALN